MKDGNFEMPLVLCLKSQNAFKTFRNLEVFKKSSVTEMVCAGLLY